MSESAATAEAPSAHATSSVSIPFVIGAAVLVGIGIMGMAYWLITFHWVFLASVLPLAAGGLLLFSKGSGPDHA